MIKSVNSCYCNLQVIYSEHTAFSASALLAWHRESYSDYENLVCGIAHERNIGEPLVSIENYAKASMCVCRCY